MVAYELVGSLAAVWFQLWFRLDVGSLSYRRTLSSVQCIKVIFRNGLLKRSLNQSEVSERVDNLGRLYIAIYLIHIQKIDNLVKTLK